MAGTFDFGGWEAEAGAPGQPGLHSKTLGPKNVSTKSPTVLVIKTMLLLLFPPMTTVLVVNTICGYYCFHPCSSRLALQI